MKSILISYGVDWERTMARFLYDEALYLECLSLLVADPNLPRLQLALAQSDLPAAFEAAHTLKGVSANMGLTPLFNAISNLVEPLRHALPIDYSPLLDAVNCEFNRVLTLHSTLTSR